MQVSISIHLFNSPGWEIGDIANITPLQLRDLAFNINTRLNYAADVLEKLFNNGWALMPEGTYKIHLIKFITSAEAAQELERIGLPHLISTITPITNNP